MEQKEQSPFFSRLYFLEKSGQSPFFKEVARLEE